MSNLDPKIVEEALRGFIGEIDYDIAKSFESDEETGEDTFDELADSFIMFYNRALDNAEDDADS